MPIEIECGIARSVVMAVTSFVKNRYIMQTSISTAAEVVLSVTWSVCVQVNGTLVTSSNHENVVKMIRCKYQAGLLFLDTMFLGCTVSEF